jgi:hypothetical protein
MRAFPASPLEMLLKNAMSHSAVLPGASRPMVRRHSVNC